jgi:hypothetical protein
MDQDEPEKQQEEEVNETEVLEEPRESPLQEAEPQVNTPD